MVVVVRFCMDVVESIWLCGLFFLLWIICVRVVMLCIELNRLVCLVGWFSVCVSLLCIVLCMGLWCGCVLVVIVRDGFGIVVRDFVLIVVDIFVYSLVSG